MLPHTRLFQGDWYPGIFAIDAFDGSDEVLATVYKGAFTIFAPVIVDIASFDWVNC